MAAFSGTTHNVGARAGADLSADQYKAVQLVSGGLQLCDDTAVCWGILQDAPADGEAATLVMDGLATAKYGATITAGQRLAPGAAGTLIVAVTGKIPIATAAEGGASGENKQVLVNIGNAVPVPA